MSDDAINFQELIEIATKVAKSESIDQASQVVTGSEDTVSFAELVQISNLKEPLDVQIEKAAKDNDVYGFKLDVTQSVKFWELAGRPQYETLDGETAREFLARINDPTKWIYGSEVRDNMFLKYPGMLPRLAHLSRKAFMRYGGEHYNPHTISMTSEHHVRTLILWTIEYKIEGRVKGYDWEWIDSFFMGVVRGELNLPLPENYKRVAREILPEFRSPYHGIEFTLPN